MAQTVETLMTFVPAAHVLVGPAQVKSCPQIQFVAVAITVRMGLVACHHSIEMPQAFAAPREQPPVCPLTALMAGPRQWYGTFALISLMELIVERPMKSVPPKHVLRESALRQSLLRTQLAVPTMIAQTVLAAIKVIAQLLIPFAVYQGQPQV